ncbi:MAG: C10 family peptidase [Bacteroidales bacterium]|nr:C10 family peptidase [Bacteroidales bacterium]
MKYSLLITIFAFLFSIVIFAEEVQIEKARLVAKNFYSEKNSNLVENLYFGEEFSVLYQNTLVYHVININTGFVIVSADDSVYPVLGYSFENSYNGIDFPPAFENWMDHYSKQIVYSISNQLSPSKIIKHAWLKYSAANFISNRDFEAVDPMIHTTWSQGCYYNSQMPADTNGPCGYLWTGCVATAMGQIMKYYNFPKTGTGSNSYYTSYGIQEADFENTTYDWLNMNYHLEEENNAVAELLYHCAVSINSILTPNGTGAYDFDARDALCDYFNFNENAQFYWRDSYAGDWEAMLRTELDEGRPVIYGGADSQTNAGHTFVCDGYHDTSFFHFNWGWNGFYNGYYYLDSLMASGSHFDFQHDAIVGISPDITGIIELYPPENLSAIVNGSDVTLSWEEALWPGNLELLGYNIYRNNTLVNSSIIPVTEFTDLSAPAGTHDYKVKTVYIGKEGSEFISTEVFVEGSSISENKVQMFEIYPNPASDYIFIKVMDPDLDVFSFSLVDLSGQEIILGRMQTNNDIVKIQLPHVSKGIYLFQLRVDSEVFSKKLLIN